MQDFQLLPEVVCMPVCIACITIDSASSMKSYALVTSCGCSPLNKVCKTLPAVWCIHSQIAFAHGFLLEVWASLMWQPWRRNWTSGPTKSPLLCVHNVLAKGVLILRLGLIFLHVRRCFSSIRTSSTKLETVSITFRVLNSYGFLQTWIIHGPINQWHIPWMVM